MEEDVPETLNGTTRNGAANKKLKAERDAKRTAKKLTKRPTERRQRSHEQKGIHAAESEK